MKKETIKEFVERGGKIEVVPTGVSTYGAPYRYHPLNRYDCRIKAGGYPLGNEAVHHRKRRVK